MLEAVQNHTPEAIVVDEIGLPAEVTAVRDIAQRGVQLVTTCHATTISDVIESPVLMKLLGDVHAVILSGKEVAINGSNQRTVVERKGTIPFDCFVEVHRPGVIVVIKDLDTTVDALLRKKNFRVEVRVMKENGSVEVTQCDKY